MRQWLLRRNDGATNGTGNREWIEGKGPSRLWLHPVYNFVFFEWTCNRRGKKGDVVVRSLGLTRFVVRFR